MKEQLITFETAKLAKEKGFNYIESNCFGGNMVYEGENGILKCAYNGNIAIGYILAPTQSLVQKWLREKYDIFLYIEYKGFGVLPFYHIMDLKNNDEIISTPFEDYENALEKGLQKALNLIGGE